MSLNSDEFSLRRARLLTLIVLMVVTVAIVLANLSSEAVSVDLLDTDNPERAYGWPVALYWRSANCFPGTLELDDWTDSPPLRLQWPVSRYSASFLTANVAIWLAMLAATSVACEWLLRRCRPRLHWRPRVTTFLALMIVLAPAVLANLSFDAVATRYGAEGSMTKGSFGWPLIWYWHVFLDSTDLGPVHGWDYSAARFAGNLAIWLLMFALMGLMWEWLLRRYRPHLRWSLRTMLVAVGLVAVLCAWCAAVRDRAQEQDALIALAGDHAVYVERWGPKWLDLVGADPYRRRVVGAQLWNAPDEWKQNAEFSQRLARLPGLRFLNIDGFAAAALDDLPQLRMLHIWYGGHEQAAHEGLAWVGKLTQLERLSMEGYAHVRSDDLAHLGGLTNLKSLKLKIVCLDEEAVHGCLAAVGKLTQLERLCLTYAWEFRSDDLAYLSGLTNLKSLAIEINYYPDEQAAHGCLSAVGKLTQLERLRLSGFKFRSDDLAYLSGLTNLKSLGLWEVVGADEESEKRESGGISRALAHLHGLRRLEALDLSHVKLGDRDLRWLTIFPGLKSLNLYQTSISDSGLAELPPLQFLEELTIDPTMATAAGVESLIAFKRLRVVHIVGGSMLTAIRLDDGHEFPVSPASDVDGLRRAAEALWHSNPRIIVDTDYQGHEEDGFYETEYKRLRDSDGTVDRGYHHSFMRELLKEP